MPLSYPLIMAALLLLAFSNASAQPLNSAQYDIGSPTLTDYYVDPVSGSDSNSGLSRSMARRTVTSIWNEIPQNSSLTSGVRINLLPGSYGTDELPNYWENRFGSFSAPVIVQAVDGYGGVFLTRDINMAGISYFYLLNVDIKNQTTDGFGDPFHCERCDHVLLRGNSFNGAPSGLNGGGDIARETIKFNQSQYIYIENNNIEGASDNGIDWVAVQYGHILGNRIHNTAGWCAYVKGGSSYTLIESNLVYDCGEGGITAGQGTGFEFMESPWLRYEANYIKIVNNLIHDVTGAGLGVNGCFNVLLAHNTVYKIGTRSHLLEVVFGLRSCDGDTSACQTRVDAGGWGTSSTGSENEQPIGNFGVKVFNNVLYNPAGTVSGSEHFAIYGPRTPSAGGIPAPQVTDLDLIIKGNIIWNGDSSMPLGIEESDQGCQGSNPTCNQSQLIADNSINVTEPLLSDPENGDFRPFSGGFLEGATSQSISDFAALDTSLNPIPEGSVDNQMVREFSGNSASTRPPGAFVNSGSDLSFPGATPPEGNTPSNAAPTVSSVRGKAKRSGKKIRVTFSVAATDDNSISSVVGAIVSGRRTLGRLSLQLRNGRYSGSKKVKSTASRLRLTATAMDGAGLSASRRATVRVK